MDHVIVIVHFYHADIMNRNDELHFSSSHSRPATRRTRQWLVVKLQSALLRQADMEGLLTTLEQIVVTFSSTL